MRMVDFSGGAGDRKALSFAATELLPDPDIGRNSLLLSA